MTEENQTITEEKEVKENKWYVSDTFKNFLVIAGGSFIGVFAALSLFALLHKPPMPKAPCDFPNHPPYIQIHNHYKGDRGEYLNHDKKHHPDKFREHSKDNKGDVKDHKDDFRKPPKDFDRKPKND